MLHTIYSLGVKPCTGIRTNQRIRFDKAQPVIRHNRIDHDWSVVGQLKEGYGDLAG